MLRNFLVIASIILVASGLVFFLVSMSHYPVGDDPGFNTSVLRSIVEQKTLHAEIPFFPQLHQTYGDSRYVTLAVLGLVASIFNVQNILILPTYFAIFCMALTLVFVFLITKIWLNSRIAGLFSIVLLAFNRWFQANFWDGSYEQYTGLLVLVALIYCILLWTKKKNYWFLLLCFLLLGLLYITHQLGFLIGSTIFITTVFFYFRTALRPRYIILITLSALFSIGLIFYLIRPGYFTINGLGYPLPAMLSQSEGIPYLLLIVFVISTAIMLFKKTNIVIFSWLIISFIFSQSMLLGVPFYAYRFNIYFIVDASVISGVIVTSMRQGLNNSARRSKFYVIISLAILIMVIFIKEFNYIHGVASWLTNQKNNPASIILVEDISAFKWLGKNSDKDEVAVAPFKWGYYLPALSGRKVVLDNAVGGDSRDARYPLAMKVQKIYTSKSANEAHDIAKDLEATFIVWDSSISRFPARYPGYTKNKFADLKYFEKVYDKDTVSIYKVK